METIVKIKCNKCGEEHSRYYHCDLDQQRKEVLQQFYDNWYFYQNYYSKLKNKEPFKIIYK